MQMKRNTKYKNNLKSIDILVIVVSLSVIILFMFLFFKNLNKTLTRDKDEIATISFKYKSVQRKFIDSAIWDRPVQFSPVYDGDIIRTSPGAEATIKYIGKKNVIELGPSTMIQVFAIDDENNGKVSLKSGNISVQTAIGSQMLINSKKSTITVEANSSLRADKSKERRLKLILEKGKASVLKNIEDQKTGKILSDNSVLSAGQVDEFFEEISGEGGDKLSPNSITMISPADNLKILNQRKKGEAADIYFEWYSTFDKSEEIILETSAFKNFSKILNKYSLNKLKNLTIKYQKGNLYWRAYPAKEGVKSDSAISGKVKVLAAYPPQLVSPIQDHTYSFKEVYPYINFVWNGNAISSSYLLEVADNKNMQNPVIKQVSNVTSLTFSSLGEGKWYWRVTPQYYLGEGADIASSEGHSFSVEKKEKLEAPKFIAPESFGKISNGKKLNFSWHAVSEAREYEVVISKNANMSDPIFTSVTYTNNFELPEEVKKLAAGDYYISVSAIGKNKSVLTQTKVQKFTVQDTKNVLRSVFPPDSYVIADTLCLDTRFTWKSNLNRTHIFQVSDTENFEKIILEKKTKNNAIDGINLAIGTWYWRVVSKVGRDLLKSEVKKVIIAPPFDKPTLIDASDKVIVKEAKKNSFKWSKSNKIDYYQVKISKPDRSSAPLYENLFITENSIDIDLNDIEDGTYVISVQGFASPTLMSSRRYSLAIDHYAYFKHIKPVKLVYPANKEKLSGVMCALEKPKFECKYIDAPSKAKVILQKKRLIGWKNITSIDTIDSKIIMPNLNAGKYRWYIKASSTDGFDISSKNKSYFEVLPINPLAKTQMIKPKKNTVYGIDYFKKNRVIEFKWTKVNNATHYIFKIKKNKRKSIFEVELNAKDFRRKENISYIFKDISSLSRGNLYVEVEAQRKNEKGIIFQNGIPQFVKFKIDLPKRKKIKTKNTGVLYGK